jgi:TPR repeat protein
LLDLVVASALAITVSLPLRAESLRDGVDAYNNGQYVEASEVFRALAEQGDAKAQFNLAQMYSNGQGVVQDHRLAVRWWRRAAEQGDPDAQMNVGVSYGFGQGVAQDYVQAHMWCDLAAAQGYERAAEYLEHVSAKMSPSEITEARRLAREWTERHDSQ